MNRSPLALPPMAAVARNRSPRRSLLLASALLGLFACGTEPLADGGQRDDDWTGAGASGRAPGASSGASSGAVDELPPDGHGDGARTAQAAAVVQLFDWPFAAITTELCALRDDGVSHVHISPPQLSNGSTEWWGRYQPLDLRVIDGPLGDEAAFAAMTAEAARCDVQIVADLVLNHAANLGLDAAELFYPPGCDRQAPAGAAAACLWTPSSFHQPECIADYGSHCAVLYGRICGGGGDRGLPDLNTGHCEPGGVLDEHSRNYDAGVFQAAKQYLLKLQDLGVRAFRVDAAKHMHPAFLRDLFGDAEVRARLDWTYGEVIASRTDDASLGVYLRLDGMDLMDFPLTRTMIDAFGYGGDLRALQAAPSLAADRAVSFVTNHDVWGNEGGLGYRFGGEQAWQDELLAHLFVLGRQEGLPYLYSELEGRSQSQLARSASQSYVRFHARPEVRHMLRFHAGMLGQAQRWIWDDAEHALFARGERGLVAINKSAAPWPVHGLALGVADGRYRDAFSGQELAVQGGRLQGDVPARWGLLLERVAD